MSQQKWIVLEWVAPTENHDEGVYHGFAINELGTVTLEWRWCPSIDAGVAAIDVGSAATGNRVHRALQETRAEMYRRLYELGIYPSGVLHRGDPLLEDYDLEGTW